MDWNHPLFVSDSIWHISTGDLALRMMIALVLGGAIGMEREWNNHPAGFRTHILVCLGSATLMILSIYGFSQFVDEPNVRIDPARLAAQVVSGIGFLGAGAILRNGSMVTGLTTAASVWVVASIGLCVGAGFYEGAIIATVLVLISLQLFNRWERRWMRSRRYHTVDMRIVDMPDVFEEIMRQFSGRGLIVTRVNAVTEAELHGSPGKPVTLITFQLKTADSTQMIDALARTAASGAVLSICSNVYEYRHAVSD